MNSRFAPSKLQIINLILILAVAFIGLPAVYFLARSPDSASAGDDPDGFLGVGSGPVETTGSADLEALQLSFRNVAKVVLPEVVRVNVVEAAAGRNAPGTSPFDFFFGPEGNTPDSRQYSQRGLGSGVIVRRDGDTYYVLTNNHVAGNASEISVGLYDGRNYPAKLVGADEYKDLALVSFIAKEDISLARLGDSDNLQPGDFVLAIGTPLGFSSTITAGIVSAVNRAGDPVMGISGFTDYIQTDAAINQGNSGGALVDLEGRLVGINTWIASQTGGSIGIGFAIPINNAKRAIDDFIRSGRVEYGWLGINSSDPPEEIVDAMNWKSGEGTFVIDIYRDSPAGRAGVLPGDLITSLAGKPVPDSNTILRIISDLRPGERVPLELIRQGKTVELTIEVGLRAGITEVSGSNDKLWPGLLVMPATRELKDTLGLGPSAGLVIVNVEDGTPASAAGFQPGDVILAVNGRKTVDMSEFYARLNEGKGEPKRITVDRGGASAVLSLPG